MSYGHQRDGLRPGSIADANQSLRTATDQFGELHVQSEFAKRAWAKRGASLKSLTEADVDDSLG
ncbi:MAG: hypothetical protein L0Z50_27765 [Verrucomicrobiales bacterium]|nr:hypothetical protein [Verrucomicrobiales bacterium]